jgi:hypothetical protein
MKEKETLTKISKMQSLVIRCAAINAEIEGMKSENNLCFFKKQIPSYHEADFLSKANQIRRIADQLEVVFDELGSGENDSN